MSDIIAIAAFKAQMPFEATFLAIKKMVLRAKTVKALNKLTARELEDIGLSRKEIKSFAARITA